MTSPSGSRGCWRAANPGCAVCSTSGLHPGRSPIRAGLDTANHHPHLTVTRRSRLVTHGSRRLDGKTERARTGQIWQLFATKEAAEKAAERPNSRGYDVIVTTAELAK